MSNNVMFNHTMFSNVTFNRATFSHAIVPLSYLYWSRIRPTLLPAVCVCLVVYVARFLPEVRILHVLSKPPSKILPILAFALVSSWFIWPNSRTLTHSASLLPGYLKTAPISTEKLVLVSLAAAMTLMAPIFFITLSLSWKISLSSKVVIALLSSATFAWLQAISWQPFRHGFIKFVLSQLIALAFFGISAYFIFVPAPLPATLPPVLVFMALGIVANFYVAKNARSKPGVTFDNSATAPVSMNNRSLKDFGSARKAQQYFELMNKPWAMPLYFILLAIIPLVFKASEATGGVNDGDLRKMAATFIGPLIILLPWGVGQGAINTSGQKGNEGVADFLMTLPITSLEFVKCKYVAAAKSLLLCFIPYLAIGLWVCSDNIAYYFEVLNTKFTSSVSAIIIFAILAATIIFTVLEYLSVFWYGFISSRISTNSSSRAIMIISSVAIAVMSLNIQSDLFAMLWRDYRGLVKLTIYLFVGIKMLAVGLAIRWSLRNFENYAAYLAWILLLWTLLFAAFAISLQRVIAVQNPLFFITLAGIFLVTPILGLVAAPAAFDYCRRR